MATQDPVFTKEVFAGKRKYFFDVLPIKSGKDLFVRITESRRPETQNGVREKHRLFIFKEDFEKVLEALDEAIDVARKELRKLNGHSKNV